jgi:hypothetical protein
VGPIFENTTLRLFAFVAAIAGCGSQRGAVAPDGSGHSAADAGDDLVAAGFAFFDWSFSTGFGCETSIEVNRSSFYKEITAALPCQVPLTDADATSIAALVTRPDVIAALVAGSGEYFTPGCESMGLELTDGTAIVDECSGSTGSPLSEVRSAMTRLEQTYCLSPACM